MNSVGSSLYQEIEVLFLAIAFLLSRLFFFNFLINVSHISSAVLDKEGVNVLYCLILQP